jgi:hypothetical protein
MRKLLFLAAILFSLACYAQDKSAQDKNPQDANAVDPATKARVRTEGVPGGTGARVPKEASGGATVGEGSQHRHSPPKPTDPQKEESRIEAPPNR